MKIDGQTAEQITARAALRVALGKPKERKAFMEHYQLVRTTSVSTNRATLIKFALECLGEKL